jgi:hypothetical protein
MSNREEINAARKLFEALTTEDLQQLSPNELQALKLTMRGVLDRIEELRNTPGSEMQEHLDRLQT